jgi:hypothetical protein
MTSLKSTDEVSPEDGLVAAPAKKADADEIPKKGPSTDDDETLRKRANTDDGIPRKRANTNDETPGKSIQMPSSKQPMQIESTLFSNLGLSIVGLKGLCCQIEVYLGKLAALKKLRSWEYFASLGVCCGKRTFMPE